MFLFGLIIGGVGGVIFGWFILPQPQWAANIWAKLRGKTA